MSEFVAVKSAYVGLYNEWSDWRFAIDAIPDTKEKNIVELGLGMGTRYLLEKFKYVYSFEVVNNDEWYNKSVTDYSGFMNWSSQFYFMHYFGLDKADKKLLDSNGDVRDTEPLVTYFKYVEDFVGPALNTMDVALVDQGFHFRGESVNYFLQKGIPIVIAHDTVGHDHIYGYDKIVVPSSYTKQFFGGLGTTMWRKI